jgi:hypothetical protein
MRLLASVFVPGPARADGLNILIPCEADMFRGRTMILVALLAGACTPAPTQRANPSFEPQVDAPTIAADAAERPRVCIDEGHHEFHTLAGRYAPFAAVLEADGYAPVAYADAFEASALARCDVLVIANALHESDVGDWSRPNPSAFTSEEIASVVAWVEGGGGLWLIADHMPFPGAAAELAGAFGFELANGFAMRSGHAGPDLFTKSDGTLADHPLTAGIAQVASFTGEAFRAPPQAQPLLVLGEGFASLEPTVAWQFDESTPLRDVAGWLQAATLEHGKGRVAMFGEAAMLTSQIVGEGEPVGLDAPEATGNTLLLRNVARWLAAL